MPHENLINMIITKKLLMSKGFQEAFGLTVLAAVTAKLGHDVASAIASKKKQGAGEKKK